MILNQNFFFANNDIKKRNPRKALENFCQSHGFSFLTNFPQSTECHQQQDLNQLCVIANNYLIIRQFFPAHIIVCFFFDILVCARKTLKEVFQGFSYFWIYQAIIIHD